MKENPRSKASQLRKADRTLRALLKTPKTREGLIAAVSVDGVITGNFVYGWLAQSRLDGTVAEIKSRGTRMYQIIPEAISETPVASVFPAWLDPRALPHSRGRTVVIDGGVVMVSGELFQNKNNKGKQKNENPDRR